MRALKSSTRIQRLVFVAVSVVMLGAATTVRVSTPSPFAPRVHVRWSSTIDDSQRAALEQQFRLLNGERRDRETWEYDLVDPSPALVRALIGHPGVADTHHIDRSAGRIASDAPAGTIRVRQRRLAAVVHSALFDWFLLFLASSSVVSGVWLAADADARD